MTPHQLRLLAWPLVLFVFVSANVFALAKVHPFTPESGGGGAPAGTVPALGDAYNGETVFQETCAGCHGDGGRGGGAGPALAGRELDLAYVSQKIDTGGGVMPPALVTGARKADVLAYIAGITKRR
jgi:mono/diheme cytochrome c family protein